MSYTILKTDGTTLTQIIDGSIDQVSSDLTLIGKNSSSYGVFINDNFVHLLENFANTSQPNYPIVGQLWFDTTENRLKVYDGTSFKVSGGTIVSNSVPSGIAQGDIWIDSSRQQLYFNDGIATRLAGPIYNGSQGISGFEVTDILDVNNVSHTVIYLFVAQSLLGIFSKDSFTPGSVIPGFTGNIQVGFNVSNYNGVKFHTPVTQADSLLGSDLLPKTAASFVSTTDLLGSSMRGTLSIQNPTPLILGTNSNTEFNVTTSIFQINSNTTNQNFGINLLNGGGLQSALFINATNKYVGLYNDSPTATLDVGGDVVIQGSLTVNGNVTSINTTNLEVEDKAILLGTTASPTDTTANGGGIQVAGTTTKSLLWNLTSTAWTSSENFNLATGKTYKINNLEVLTSNSLGAVITSAPGLTSVGSLTTLTAGNLYTSGNTIAFVSGSQPNGDVILAPKGTGSVDVNGAHIINLNQPVNYTDAANKFYVDTAVTSIPLTTSLTTTGLTNPQIATNYLSKIFPFAEHTEQSICRAVCTDGGVTTIRVFKLLSETWVYQSTL
jgi:hypothetical protein